MMQKLFDDVIREDPAQPEDIEVAHAVRFALVAACTGSVFLAAAAWWAGSCAGLAGVGTASCAAPQRMVLGLGAPAILLAAAIWAFARTYRLWHSDGPWRGWQGAGWILLILMMVTLMMGFPPIAGLALAG